MSDKNFKVKNGADIGGTVTATAFVGDGSSLTGISSYSAPTIGSTSVASGATVTTIAGLTLNNPTLTGTVSLPTGSVTSTMIADSTIATGDIADGAITSAKILDGTIATGDIADSAITSAKIADATIVAGDLADGAVTSAKILNDTIVNADINSSAAIALSKLANGTSGQIIVANASGVPTWVSETGDVTISDTGVTAIASGVIVDADVNASAAIAQSKISGLTADLAAKAPLAAPAFTGTATAVNLTISGDLTVNGTTTNLNSTNLVIEDKNIVLGDTGTPTDTTADGGGITLKGATDKTFNWVDSTDAWTSSEHINLASGKTLKYNGTDLVAAQSGNSGKYLTTDGTSTSWGTLSGYSAPTIGSTSIASGATVTTIAGLTLTSPVINNPTFGYQTRTAANTTTTLTASSTRNQYITGSSPHTFRLPVASTMLLGQTFNFTNRIATNNVVRIETSDGSFIGNLFRGQTLQLTCILTSGTSSASWTSEIIGFEPLRTTGDSLLVFSNQPTLVNATLTSPTSSNPALYGAILYDSLMANGSTGNNGQVLSSTGSGVQWIDAATGGTVIGSGAYRAPGTSDVIIGDQANSGASETKRPTVAIGFYAAANPGFDGYGGIAIGESAAIAAGGDYYVVVGTNAGSYQNPSTVGLFGDVFIGMNAGAESYNRSGNRNTAIGYRSGANLTSGSNNTFIGYESSQGGGGYSAVTGTQTGSNNIVIGYQARPSSNSVSNQVTLGNSSISSLRCQVTSISGLSDQRDKTNIENLPIGIDFINSLRPVKFEWDTRDESKVGVEDFGFIAQEVMEAEDAINAHDWLALTLRDNEEKYELAPAKLVPILVKAIQDLSEEIKSLKNNNNLN